MEPQNQNNAPTEPTAEPTGAAMPQPTVVAPTQPGPDANPQPAPAAVADTPGQPPATPVASAPSQAGPIVGGANQAPTQMNAIGSSKGSFISKIGTVPLVIIIVVLLAGASAGAYFGLILPNNPTNLWKKSLSNTSKGLDKYVEYAKKSQEIKGAKIKGTFNADSDGVVFDGSFEGSMYESDSNIKANIGAAGSRVDMELLTHAPAGAKNPDIYMRLKGLEGLSSILGSEDPQTAALLKSVNNQWYTVDHTLLDQAQSETGTNALTATNTLTNEELGKIYETIASVSKRYLLSSSPDTAVMTVRQNVGKEERDGRKLYHYKVGLNKENLKQYVTTLKDELKKTKLGESYKNPSFEEAMDFDGVLKDIDKMDESRQADVWVDRSTKLIRIVRFTEKDKPNNYLEFAMNYNGGDTYPFGIKLKSDDEGDKGDVGLDIELDTKKNLTTIALKLDIDSKEAKAKAEFKMTAEASEEKVPFTKPVDAKSIYELLGAYMGGAGGSTTIPPVTAPGNFDL